MMRYSTLFLMAALLLFVCSSCSDDDSAGTRDIAGILSYSIQGQSVTFSIDQTNGNITNDEPLSAGTDVTNLVAAFELTDDAKATINGVEQESGVTANNFTLKVTYKVVSGDRQAEKEYDVLIN